MKKYVVMLTVLMLVGCGARTQKYWVNPAVTTQEAADKDFRECIYEGQKIKFQVEGSGKGLQGYNDGNYAEMVTRANCMQSRGYNISDTLPNYNKKPLQEEQPEE